MQARDINIVLQIVQICNVIASVTSTIIGYKNLKYNSYNKVLIFLPLNSIIQVLLSEIALFYRPLQITDVGRFQQITVAVYSIIEFLVISIFIYSTQNNRKLNQLNKVISSVIFLISFIEISIIIKNNDAISLEYFNLTEGLFIIPVLLTNIIRQLKNTSFYETFTNSEWISKLGILLAFMIFWPNNFIQKIIINNTTLLYQYFFISNSIGYLIMFVFLSLSFYASRKSRVT